MLINEYGKQFFLYAKGWYQKSNDVWNDLEKLYAIHYLPGADKHDILNKVTQCAFECILEKPRNRALDMMQDFIDKLSPSYYLRFVEIDGQYDYNTEVVRLCLGVMRFAEIDNLDPKVDCYPNVLPLSKEALNEENIHR